MPSDLDKLDAIVGAALRALVESGASDAAIGSFAANHREKVAQIMGMSATITMEPDIHDVVASAVARALEASGIAKVRRKKPKFTVIVAGKRTCVTLDQGIIDRLKQSSGSEGRSREVIQDIASRVPASTQNRSAWIEERILAFLSAPPEEHRTAAH